MISEYKQWWIGLVVSVALAVVAVVISVLAWLYPQSPPSTSSPGDEVYFGLKRYNEEVKEEAELEEIRNKYQEAKNKYVHTITLSSDRSVGWVDTGIVIKRNQRIAVSTNEEYPTSNYWSVLLNREPGYNEDVANFSNRWSNGDGFSGEIATNDILGDKQEDTLKLSAYWYDQRDITVDVIVDLDSYYAALPNRGESCLN